MEIMKGKIITGRPVLLEDMTKAGLLQLKPNLPPKTKNSRYWRQHKEKEK